MKIDIKNKHKGEDYYSFEVNGKVIEVSISEGDTIFALMNVIKNTINKSTYHREVIKF